MLLNFASMFIVIPFLASEPAVYGIYTVCTSLSVFFTYADLGFIRSGQKYAAESFAAGQRKEEISIIGFTSFILFTFVLVLMAIILFLGLNPQYLFSQLDTPWKMSVASNLLYVLGWFAPVSVLQRMNQIIFGIRLDEFLVQRVASVSHVIKILSAFYFFANNKYSVVEYFFFTQVMNLIASLVSLAIAKRIYNYDIVLLLRSFGFKRDIFRKVNKLAFSSLFLMISWVLYYELDSIAIGKFLGADQVAAYAIGFSFLTVFRSMFGIIYSPFNARFNHCIGEGNVKGLQDITTKLVRLTMPVVIMPQIALVLFLRPFILSWVGAEYVNSVGIARFLILCNMFAFITYPSSMSLFAREKVKQIYFVSAILPLIFWGGVIVSYEYFGLQSFAICKFLAFGISAIYYLTYLLRYLGLSLSGFYNEVIRPSIGPVGFLFAIFFFCVDALPDSKSRMNLLVVVGTIGVSVGVSYVLQYFISPEIRNIFKVFAERNS